MNETIIVAIIGGLAAVASAIGSGLLVYRRSVRVDVAKVAQEEDFGLIDRWKEYSAELRQQVKDLTDETRDQDEKIEQLQRENREYAHRIFELEQRLADMERRLAGVEKREA